MIVSTFLPEGPTKCSGLDVVRYNAESLHEEFGVPGGDFSAVVGGFQTNYSFSRFLTLSALVQIDTANTQASSANIRLRWNYRPDSDL